MILVALQGAGVMYLVCLYVCLVVLSVYSYDHGCRTGQQCFLRQQLRMGQTNKQKFKVWVHQGSKVETTKHTVSRAGCLKLN